jgi:hypothetical protein
LLERKSSVIGKSKKRSSFVQSSALYIAATTRSTRENDVCRLRDIRNKGPL